MWGAKELVWQCSVPVSVVVRYLASNLDRQHWHSLDLGPRCKTWLTVYLVEERVPLLYLQRL